jgi:hypothetical protein
MPRLQASVAMPLEASTLYGKRLIYPSFSPSPHCRVGPTCQFLLQPPTITMQLGEGRSLCASRPRHAAAWARGLARAAHHLGERRLGTYNGTTALRLLPPATHAAASLLPCAPTSDRTVPVLASGRGVATASCQENENIEKSAPRAPRSGQ